MYALRKPHNTRSLDPSVFALLKANGILHYRGVRAGRGKRRSIHVITSARVNNRRHLEAPISRVLVPIPPAIVCLDNSAKPMTTNCVLARAPPVLYVINATSLAKPDAMQHLYTDIQATGAQVIVVTETWFKPSRHDANIISICGFACHRRDRQRRVGGGVAIFVSDKFKSQILAPPGDNELFELLWVKVMTNSDCFVYGGLYHPPSPKYQTSDLVDFINNSVDFVFTQDSTSIVVVAGDHNQLPDSIFFDLGLDLYIHAPTHKGHFLDKVFATQPIYTTTKTVTSSIKTEHLAIVARADDLPIIDANKSHRNFTMRKPTPAKNAAFFAATRTYDWSSVLQSDDPQQAADAFYSCINSLLDLFYPQSTITLTSRDPSFVTPALKQLLRLKNSFMRRGKTDKADALSLKIRSAITTNRATKLSFKDRTPNSGDLWKAVKDITGRNPSPLSLPLTTTVTADSLNQHYSAISSDPSYDPPPQKHTCCPPIITPSEIQVFYALAHLRPTASGPDNLPYWFLRTAAPVLALPLSHLFQLSLRGSTVPSQWKSANIFPLPKIPQPLTCSDYRPISLTSILCRVLERLLLREYYYPLLIKHPYPLYSLLSDQYAYRPTGSTTAALISILHLITTLLETNPYVHLITFDYSKAFDTVSHASLMKQVAKIDLPDQLYNWIISFLTGRSQSTHFQSNKSSSVNFSAGVVQGSAIGPAAFTMCVSTYRPLNPDNHDRKFADDMYLIVPSTNTHTIPSELVHIATWATLNNLRLNPTKSAELLIKKPRSRVPDPPILPSLPRVTNLKVLGVTLQSDLHMTAHVNNLVTRAGQTTYALKLVKSHGLPPHFLDTITHATLFSVMTYASPAWIGFASTEDQKRLQASITRAHRWGLSTSPVPLQTLCDKADNTLFSKLVTFGGHVLHSMLPDQQNIAYNLRPRGHSYVLPGTSQSLKRNFLHRMLYKLASVKPVSNKNEFLHSYFL